MPTNFANSKQSAPSRTSEALSSNTKEPKYSRGRTQLNNPYVDANNEFTYANFNTSLLFTDGKGAEKDAIADAKAELRL